MSTQTLRDKRDFHALTAALMLAAGMIEAATVWAKRAADLTAQIEKAEA